MDGKAGLAFHLTCAFEVVCSDLSQQLPSWLVCAAALGPHVRYEADSIVGLLKQDFAQFSKSYVTTGNSEWNQAITFLCIAASLRPTLLAPDTDALKVLRELRMTDGLSPLDQYCQLIAAYGEEFPLLDSNAVKTTATRPVGKLS